MVFAHVMTGVAHYNDFAGQQNIVPVAVAIDHGTCFSMPPASFTLIIRG